MTSPPSRKRFDASEVLVAGGDRAGAEAALSESMALHEQKGNIVPAQQCRERLASLGPPG
jgi:hypothetical protein